MHDNITYRYEKLATSCSLYKKFLYSLPYDSPAFFWSTGVKIMLNFEFGIKAFIYHVFTNYILRLVGFEFVLFLYEF